MERRDRERDFQKRGTSVLILLIVFCHGRYSSLLICGKPSAILDSITNLTDTAMTTVLTVLVLLFTLEPLKSFTCYPCHPQFHPSSPSTIAGSPIGSFAHFKTPRLENLVLKVEVWELLTHVVEEFPSCLSKGTVGPLNEDFSDSI